MFAGPITGQITKNERVIETKSKTTGEYRINFLRWKTKTLSWLRNDFLWAAILNRVMFHGKIEYDVRHFLEQSRIKGLQKQDHIKSSKSDVVRLNKKGETEVQGVSQALFDDVKRHFPNPCDFPNYL